MGNTEQKQAEAMKRYIREVFIPEYASNFNKEISASDIKFYGKIHFTRNRSSNDLNMHCHLIVSRKDQTNKKKLSPLTNHKRTKTGVIRGGFDRINLFQQVEDKFDKLFNYNRQQIESFNYYNTIKNGSVYKQLKIEEQESQSSEKEITINKYDNRENLFPFNLTNEEVDKKAFNTYKQTGNEQNYNLLKNHSTESFVQFMESKGNFSSNPNIEEEHLKKIKKKRKFPKL